MNFWTLAAAFAAGALVMLGAILWLMHRAHEALRTAFNDSPER